LHDIQRHDLEKVTSWSLTMLALYTFGIHTSPRSAEEIIHA